MKEPERVLGDVVASDWRGGGNTKKVRHAHGKKHSRGVESRGKKIISWEWC